MLSNEQERSARVNDRLGRPLRDLRISLTDRCNMRCAYCMPAEVFGPDYAFLEGRHLLTFSEIVRLTSLFVDLGARKIRLTGGEPLLRRNLPDLVTRLRALSGIEEIALTTNGWLLAPVAEKLQAAGLDRVSVSLDALDERIFHRMNGNRLSLAPVLEGIDRAAAAGLPVKINMVVQRGVNEDQILPMADAFRERGLTLRFIEYMDTGNHTGWRRENVVPFPEIRDRIAARHRIAPLPPAHPGETARRYRYLDSDAEIGFIASVTAPFCRDCNRARLSADGRLHTCLFSALGHDLRTPLRAGDSDRELLARINGIWGARRDRYSEERGTEAAPPTPKPEMSYLGG